MFVLFRPDGARDKMLTEHVMRAHAGVGGGSTLRAPPMSVPATRIGGNSGHGGVASRFEEVRVGGSAPAFVRLLDVHLASTSGV